MSETAKLVATARETFGKGVARKLRAAGQTPVVVYGHGADPVHLSVETHPLTLIVRHANALIELDIEGKKQLVLVKDVQKDPVRQIVEHIDLIVVRKGEKVTVDVSIHLEGDAAPGTTVNQDANTISLEAEATHIPESIVVSIEGATDGTQIFAKDIPLPSGSSLLSDPDQLVVAISAAAAQDLGDEPAADAPAEEAAAE